MASNGFFEVVGDEEEVITNADTIDEITINMFRDNAIRDGYGETTIEAAIALIDSNTKTYDDFEKLIDIVIENERNHKFAEQVKEKRRQASIYMEVEKLRSVREPAKYLEQQIYNVYNTTAVQAMELVCESEHNENLQLDIYEEPIYSLIIQLKRPWVEDLVNHCLAKWDGNPVIEGYIMQYLESTDIKPEQYDAAKKDLISYLPIAIRNECSPDTYKVFRAVQLIMQDKNKGNCDARDEIFDDEDDLVRFSANFENYVDEDVPYEAANAAATEDYYNPTFEERASAVANGIGNFVGKTVSFKYNMAKSFDDAMCESMGEYADVYKANRQRIREQKEELKARKAELKHEKEMAELNEKMQERKDKIAEHEERQRIKAQQQSQQMYYDNRYNNYRGNTNYRGYNQSYRGYNQGYRQSRDFAPQIPLPVMIGIGNLIVWLIIALLFGTTSKLVSGVGLVVALFGFIRKQIGEPNAVTMIVGGYVVAVLGVLFGIM